MDVQFGTTDRRRLSRFTTEGATGVLAALGFAFAALWPNIGPQLRLLTAASREPAIIRDSGDVPRDAPAAAAPLEPVAAELASLSDSPYGTAPADAAAADESAALNTGGRAPGANARPIIESVSVRGNAAVTAASDIQLAIAASDMDGDPLQLRTRWTINDRSLETEAALLPKSEIQRGDRVSAIVVAHDGHAASDPFGTPVLLVGNATPKITTFPSGFDTSGSFVYPMGAVDPDGDRELVYQLIKGPSGMTIESHEGTLRWAPSSNQTGRHSVEVEVRDGRGAADRQSFDLHVGRYTRPANLAGRGVEP